MSRSLRLRPGTVEWRRLEDEVVAVDTRNTVYMAVNRSGAVLWPMLLDGATRDELISRLATAYDLQRTEAERDVDAFVRALEDQDLLEP